MSTLDKYSSKTHYLPSKFLDAKLRKRTTTIDKSEISIQNFYNALLNLIQAKVLSKWALGYYMTSGVFRNKFKFEIVVVETSTTILTWIYTYSSEKLFYEQEKVKMENKQGET